MPTDKKHIQTQDVVRRLMESSQRVYAALANPENMSEEFRAEVEAARPRLEKYHARPIREGASQASDFQPRR